MSELKIHKIRCLFADIAMAVILVLFVYTAMSSPTIGNPHFYDKYASSSQVTTFLQDDLQTRTDSIANETGIDAKAFSYAVGQTKISKVQKQISYSVFSGTNYDYTESEDIEKCYTDGIKDYYRTYGLDIDNDALNRAVPMACQAFNRTMGIANTSQVAPFLTITSKVSIIGAILLFLLGIYCLTRIFAFNMGRTKSLSHLGCSFTSAGLALVLIAFVNVVFNLVSKLYVTSNAAVNYITQKGADTYFIVSGIFGIAFIVAGIYMLNYTYHYYVRKVNKEKEDEQIDKSIVVNSPLGDITVEELVNTLENNEINENGVK